jgi:hypothetical protein
MYEQQPHEEELFRQLLIRSKQRTLPKGNNCGDVTIKTLATPWLADLAGTE